MEKLKRALDEVDAKVASLRNRFETLTKEAAELKIKLDKENETIQAAETLVTKLEGEYQRWSRQVRTVRGERVVGGGRVIRHCTPCVKIDKTMLLKNLK